VEDRQTLGKINHSNGDDDSSVGDDGNDSSDSDDSNNDVENSGCDNNHIYLQCIFVCEYEVTCH